MTSLAVPIYQLSESCCLFSFSHDCRRKTGFNTLQKQNKAQNGWCLMAAEVKDKNEAFKKSAN